MRARLAAAALAAVAVIALAAGTLQRGAWGLPVHGPGPEAAGITSRATLESAVTWSNHALYALAMLLCVVALAALPWRAGEAHRPAPAPPLPRRWTAVAAAAALLLSATILVLVLASPAGDLSRPLEDLFHEGEYLGFLPVFAHGGEGFGRSFLIHGFGMNVLPSLVAHAIGAGISAARAVRLGFLLAAWAGFGAILWIASWRRDGASPPVVRFAGMLAVFAFALQTYDMTERLAVHAWGIAAALWLLARARSPLGRLLVAPGLSVGALLALGPLYNYAEALSFAPVVATLPLLVAARAPGRLLPMMASIACGAAAVAGAVLVTAGAAPYAAAFEQIRFWASTSAAVWFLPFGDGRALRLFWIAAASHVMALALLARACARSGWRAALAEHAEVVVLLLFAALAMRTQLARADVPHMRWVGVPAAALLAVTADRWIGAAPWRRRGLAVGVVALLAAAFLGVVGRARPARVRMAAVRLATLSPALRTPDDALLPPMLRAAVEQLRSAVRDSSCFYTLSSEGAYYYLLDRPSCSRFHQVAYARTAAAQAEVIRDLEGGAPEFILMASGAWFDHIDGVPVSVSNALIDRWIRARYRPERVIGTHVVWRRTAPP